MKITYFYVGLILCWCSSLLNPLPAMEQAYRAVVSHLENPQRDVGESEKALQGLRTQIELLIAKPIAELSENDRRIIHIDELTNFSDGLSGCFSGLMADPMADDLSPESRRRFLSALQTQVLWFQATTEQARAEIVAAHRANKVSRFHPRPAEYLDREGRVLLPEEHTAAIERIKAIIPILEREDYPTLVRDHFSYDPQKPLTDEEIASSVAEIKLNQVMWRNITQALKRGEKIGYQLVYWPKNEIRILPITTINEPPTWTYVQLYMRPGVPGCAIWNFR